MNKISPTELTRDIAGSAAVQIAEYDYTEKIKNCSGRSDMTACIPQKIVEKATRDIPVGAVFVGIDLSTTTDMTGHINIKRLLQNENN